MNTAGFRARVPTHNDTCSCVAAPLATLLRQLGDVVGALGGTEYRRPAGALFANSTVGAHVRHCLDHVRALADGHAAGVIDYDHRDRNTSIQTHREDALAEISRLAALVDELAFAESMEAVRVVVMPTRDGPSVSLASTLARELSFVLSHTIHHNATIRGMIQSFGRSVPESFGYAPSTLSHMDASRCAR